jgi:hypothetical protein
MTLKRLAPRSFRYRLGSAVRARHFKTFRNRLPEKTRLLFEEIDPGYGGYMLLRQFWLERIWPQGILDQVWTSSVMATKALRERSIPARFAPIGYHPRMGQDLGLERDIDVLFIGHPSGRRMRILDHLDQELAARGFQLKIITRGCYGQTRLQLLNRTRICLNLVRCPWYLGGVRFLMSMGCGAVVVSEPLLDPRPYQPGVHFIQAEPQKMVQALVYYLENETERRHIADQARHFVTTELTLDNTTGLLFGSVHPSTTEPDSLRIKEVP